MTKQEGKVAVSELSFYKVADDENVFEEESPLVLQPFVAQQWEYVRPGYRSLESGYLSVRSCYRGVRDFAQAFPHWFTDERKVTTAKALAITVGGMGGYVLAARRGGGLIRRTLYSGIGLSFLAAFCYPHQTMDIGRAAYLNMQRRWEGTRRSSSPHYPPKQSSPPSSSPSGQGNNKDIDLYSTRSTKVN